MVAFALARAFGRKLLVSLFGPERISRYDKWTGSRNRFAKFFALAIVLPVAPDDFLCYLAGTTKLSWRCFSATIFLSRNWQEDSILCRVETNCLMRMAS